MNPTRSDDRTPPARLLAEPAADHESAPPPDRGGADDAQARQQALYQQIAADVAMQESLGPADARIRSRGPRWPCWARSESRWTSPSLEKPRKDVILRVSTARRPIRRSSSPCLPQIELNDRNQATMKDLQHERQSQQEVEAKFAQKVDEFRTLIHEQRFAEAEIVAKQAAELKPDDPVSMLLIEESKTLRRVAENRDTKERKNQGSSTPWPQSIAQFDSIFRRDADRLSGHEDLEQHDRPAVEAREGDRPPWRGEGDRNPPEAQNAVSLQFENAPLSQVLAYMSKIAGINIYPDPQGLAEEGVTTDTPVVINLPQEVKLEERPEPDPPSAPFELRRKGRGAQDHQRAASGRRPDRQDLQRGRSGDPHS